MFDPAAQRLMEKSFGVGSGFEDDPGTFQNSGVAANTTRTTRVYQGSPKANGSTVITVGGNEERPQRMQTDLNHNVHMHDGTFSASPPTVSMSQGRQGKENYLAVPGSSATVQVTSTQKTTRRERSPAGRKSRSSKTSAPSTMDSELLRVETGSPQVQAHSSSKQHTSSRHVPMYLTDAPMHAGSMQATPRKPLPELMLQSPDTHSTPGRMTSSGTLMSTTGRSSQLQAQTDSMLHSPGGMSDTSWASLPTAFKGPFPPGKAPIDIQVHSPTHSDGSHDGGHRVRDVVTEVPQDRRGEDAPKGKKFLKKVQQELEEQRGRWKEDVDKLTGGMIGLGVDRSRNGETYGSSSYVDTSSGQPVFKAAVDLSGYNAKDISVTVDKLLNKAVVQAVHRDHTGHPTKTFTQRIQLPRFSDDQRLTSKLSKSGQLKLEVPLIYHFADMHQEGRKAKSFVYQVNKGKNGQERLEILVNTGSGFRAHDLKIQVHDDNRLVIIGEKEGGPKKLIKQYTLPAQARVDGITSRLGKDGRLQVNVPIKRADKD